MTTKHDVIVAMKALHSAPEDVLREDARERPRPYRELTEKIARARAASSPPAPARVCGCGDVMFLPWETEKCERCMPLDALPDDREQYRLMHAALLEHAARSSASSPPAGMEEIEGLAQSFADECWALGRSGQDSTTPGPARTALLDAFARVMRERDEAMSEGRKLMAELGIEKLNRKQEVEALRARASAAEAREEEAKAALREIARLVRGWGDISSERADEAYAIAHRIIGRGASSSARETTGREGGGA